MRSPAATAVDGALGAALTAVVGLGITWVLGALALANGGEARREVQRSTILQHLNTMLPPSSGLIEALARLDPFPRIDGPEARVPAPTAGIARAAGVVAAADSVVKILGNACGLGVEGSGLGRGAGARGHQRARRRGAEGHAGAAAGRQPGLDARAVAFDPRNDLAVLRVPGLKADALSIVGSPKSGTSAAILGFPGNGPYDVRAGRIGATREVITQDAYGQGPVRRSITSLRGAVRSGNSGGPMVDSRGAGGHDGLRGDHLRAARRLRRAQRARARGAGAGARVDRRLDRSLHGVALPSRREMGKTLVIAEKPSVGRDLTKALPGAFAKHEGYLESDTHVVTWAVGHLVQLAEPDEYDAKYKKWRMADLPIVPDRFKLVVRDERSRKQMTVITRMLKRDDVSEVINACDAGREGELIFAWTFEKAGAKKPVQRLWLSSMTSKAIKEAFAALRPASEFDLLEQAARSRSEADWIVGMNATRAATIRLRSSFDGAVSLGRVQTPTLAIIARREEEIRAFVPEPYWLVDATFEPVRRPARHYVGRFHAGAQPRLATAEEADGDRRRRARRRGRDHQAREDDAPREGAAAVRPHVAAARGQHALRVLRAPHAGGGAAAVRGAQGAHVSAYELALPAVGHDRARSSRSPRWSGTHREYARAAAYVTGLDVLPLGRVINDAKVTDHHAIIPTNSEHKLDKLSDDDRRIYDMVTRRFLAVFHPDAVFENTRLETTVARARLPHDAGAC